MKTIAIIVDGRSYDVEEGKNLLQACLSAGLNLPYFCWHPALHSVGACRQCAVKVYRDANDTRGRIVMSCMTPVAAGMRLSVEDPEARAFRASITEWLMVNHPHDCPICDEGGECHLQDMTVMTGHNYRRYRFTKRTHVNQDLGPFIKHEMNRCIQCYRCVRFYRDYAGGRDFEVQGWHDDVYFGRKEDGTLENEFSGNLVEVCPTGVFTDKSLWPHFARKWDLQTAPSICEHCAVGCNTIPGERSGLLRRIRARFNGEVNGYFLCDRGRYGYEYVNAATRIRTMTDDAPARAAAAVSGGTPLVGVGSPRASLETNFALRDLVGPGNFFLGVSDARLALLKQMIDILSAGPAPAASVKEAAGSDAVLVLGEDVWNTAPVLALNLRQAALNGPAAAAMKQKRIHRWEDAALREAIGDKKGPFFVASVEPTELDGVAMESWRASPADIARLGFAAAHEIDSDAPAVDGLPEEARILAQRIARAFMLAEKPLVVSGSGLGSADVIRAAANLARALKNAGKDARISFVFPDANSFGAAMIADGGIESALKAVRASRGAALVLAETDLFREVTDSTARALLSAASHVISVDHTAHATTAAAEIVLPAAPVTESSGTFVSMEGRAQRFFAAAAPQAPVREAWAWLGELAAAAGRRSSPWQGLDSVIDAIARELPSLAKIRDAAPKSDFRIVGQRVPRKTFRESGRTAVTAHIDLHEPKPPADPDSPLAYTMEGRLTQPPSSLITHFWSPGWNSIQAINKFQIEVGGPLRGGDPGIRLVEPGAHAAPAWFPAPSAAAARAAGTFTVVPRHYVFGSEELSVISQGVAQRAPKPYLALGAEDARGLGLSEGQTARVSWDSTSIELPVVIRDLPRGIASVPWGVPGMPLRDLPAAARVAGGGGS